MKNMNKLLIVITSVIIIVLFISLKGFIGLWTAGIAHIAGDTKKYTDTKSHIVEGSYSILIELSDLQSNIGKELYNDGTHIIYVNWIYNEVNSGDYIIGFRSSGNYSLKYASLVSGVHHARINEHSYTYDMSAKMTVEYKGKVYNSSVRGISGLNYKDGDDFSFYIFPSEAYRTGEITLDEKGTVELTVTDLYKNVWSKR